MGSRSNPDGSYRSVRIVLSNVPVSTEPSRIVRIRDDVYKDWDVVALLLAVINCLKDGGLHGELSAYTYHDDYSDNPDMYYIVNAVVEMISEAGLKRLPDVNVYQDTTATTALFCIQWKEPSGSLTM